MTRRKRHKSKQARQRKHRAPSGEAAPATTAATSPASPESPTAAADVASSDGGGSLARRSLLRLLVVVAVVVGYLALVIIVSGGYRNVGKLSGRDVLALPGETVELQAKIEHDGPAFFNPDVTGAPIEFRLVGPLDALPIEGPVPADSEGADDLGGDRLGTGSSDADGFASVSFTAPQEPGNYLVRLRLAGEHPEMLQLRNEDIYLLVSVVAAETPILLTDIDNTISQTDLSDTIDDRPEKVPPLEGAVETLIEASTSMQVVYLSARPTALSRRTKRWLAVHGFPPGPAFLRDLSDEFARRYSESRYKNDLIRALKKRWTKIVWGIGNTAGDLRAYVDNGVPAILVGVEPAVAAEHPSARIAADWSAVREIILE